jgi:hypothetical protein
VVLNSRETLMEERLPSKHETLCSSPSTAKMKEKKDRVLPFPVSVPYQALMVSSGFQSTDNAVECLILCNWSLTI